MGHTSHARAATCSIVTWSSLPSSRPVTVATISVNASACGSFVVRDHSISPPRSITTVERKVVLKLCALLGGFFGVLIGVRTGE